VQVDNRQFAPPTPDLARINARLAKLLAPLPELIQRAGEALGTEDLRTAQALLGRALSLDSSQPDVLRLYGLLLAKLGNLPAAAANFEAAIRAVPDDAMGYWQYAQVCEEAGDIEGALRLRKLAVGRLPASPLAWADLGEHLSRHHDSERALSAIEQSLALAPDYAPAHLKRGDTLVACGRPEEGAEAMRRAIAIEPAYCTAWLNLVDIKTVPVTDAEVQRMRDLLGGEQIDEGERTALGFALARVYEQRGRHTEAFELLLEANARRKREVTSWDVDHFQAQRRLEERVFDGSFGEPVDPQLGGQVIFILGMPRSGTTLVEQILSSHPEVEGAGELGELAQVLTEESSRRQQRFPEWVSTATETDWHRLGLRYLELTAAYRVGHGRFTDKMPNNWQALGAIRAMLPAARIVICRRDPLENCWSCFKQYFPRGWVFTYDIDQLALFWKAFDHAASRWAAHDPAAIREQGYEALTEEPEREIRGLLDFCDLPFDPACLAFHTVRRNVHTLSAGQVRQPMRRHADIAATYGALLDPLRRALGIVPIGGRPPSAALNDVAPRA